MLDSCMELHLPECAQEERGRGWNFSPSASNLPAVAEISPPISDAAAIGAVTRLAPSTCFFFYHLDRSPSLLTVRTGPPSQIAQRSAPPAVLPPSAGRAPPPRRADADAASRPAASR